MTDEIISSHIVAAMLALDVAKKAAASRAGWDSVEEWSRVWGGVVSARRALWAAAGPNCEAHAPSLEPRETGDWAEYLHACLWALETLGPQADTPGLMVARACVENVAREVARISVQGSEPSESGGSWRRLNAALLARGHRSCIATRTGHRHMPGSS